MASAFQPLSTLNHRHYFWIASGLVAAAALWLIYRDGLVHMVGRWTSEEYSHGYLIPVIAVALVWQRRRELVAIGPRGSWFGPAIVLLALIVGVMGTLSTIYMVIQYAFVLAVVGIVLAFLGWRGTVTIWVPLAFLVFMIPLPNFLQIKLSTEMQLISSVLGVALIRLMDISVFLEGNLIDLGAYKLQVAEACSGLRYLFPLMSFGFLIAYLYIAPFWRRAVVFLSTIPITILMNSFRVGVIGILVEYYGVELAEGFLHDFEGWAVFMLCCAVLFAEIWVLDRLSSRRRGLHQMFNFASPPARP